MTNQQILSLVAAGITNKSDAINPSLIALTLGATTTWAFTPVNPNRFLLVTGNTNINITGTANGDSGLLRIIKSTGNETINFSGIVFGSLVNNVSPQFITFLNDGGVIYWFAENAQISIVTQIITTGSATINNNTNLFIYNNSATVASATITLPASPIDGQSVDLFFVNSVTALIIAANTGQTISQAAAPTTATAAKRIGYNYISSLLMWVAKQ